MKLIQAAALCVLTLGALQKCGATIMNHSCIEKTSMTVQEPLVNSGTVSISQQLSLHDTTENSGSIEAETLFVNGMVKNQERASIRASTMFVSASCGLLHNRGTLIVDQLHLPAFGARIKLNLIGLTSIAKLYRGNEYLGGISFIPEWSHTRCSTITITDDNGIPHTFTDTTQNLENFLENALNEKGSATALLAYLRSVTKKE